jgi:WD repeat-containing protein 19
MIAWSKSSSGSHVLAVGTVKGNLQLYNIRERRRTPIVGKHTKRVCCGVWSSSVLAMAALDKTVGPEACCCSNSAVVWSTCTC